MKFNLKNRPEWFDSRDAIDKWFEGFENELREDKDWCERCLAEDPLDEYCTSKLKWIKGIFGE